MEMTGTPFFRKCLPALACALAFASAGCGIAESEPPACRPGMPAQAELLRLPALASLTFHRRTNYDVSRGAGSDLWADSKFEYKAALEFSVVPSRKKSSGTRFCADALSIKLALPLDGPRQEMLRSLVRSVASSAGWKAEALQIRLDELVAKHEKFRPIGKESGVSTAAGKVSHPNRGELFVVVFIWE